MNIIGLPPPNPLPDKNPSAYPEPVYGIVADDAFPQEKYTRKPYPGRCKGRMARAWMINNYR
jgi:hypothetical protein